MAYYYKNDPTKAEEVKTWWEQHLPTGYTERDVLLWLKSGVNQKKIVYKYWICNNAVQRVPELYEKLFITTPAVQAELKAMSKRVNAKRTAEEQILCLNSFRTWWRKELSLSENRITGDAVLQHLRTVIDQHRLCVVLDAWIRKVPFHGNTKIHKMIGMGNVEVQKQIKDFTNRLTWAPYDYQHSIHHIDLTHYFYIRTDKDNLKYGMTCRLRTRWPQTNASQHYLVIIGTVKNIARKLELEMHSKYKKYSPKNSGYNEYLSKKKLEDANITVHDLAAFAATKALQIDKKSITCILHPNEFGVYKHQTIDRKSRVIEVKGSTNCCDIKRTEIKRLEPVDGSCLLRYLLSLNK